jgi:hypothetical protein
MKQVLAKENYSNSTNDYNISVIEEHNGDVISTIREIQSDREVAVFRKNYGKAVVYLNDIIEEAKKSILIFPYMKCRS